MTDLEINKLIHEKVFGKCWHTVPEDAKGSEVNCPDCGQSISFLRETENGKTQIYLRNSERKHYLTTSAAFNVAEYLRKLWLEQNPDETQFFQIIDCCENGWRVEINWGHHDGVVPVSFAVDKSLPKAICLAIVEKFAPGSPAGRGKNGKS